ncbi:12361_t:CDS:2 [Dentiscutata erythropus]|uniref:12361_t:CDS:1 n=1 Tax=Dentiscutata erythropus TaxID=1348616 RepID=A0A9N8ZRA5_9GLOM|nr:12361_t:CDS:2 [Dentiscutata erythropus]
MKNILVHEGKMMIAYSIPNNIDSIHQSGRKYNIDKMYDILPYTAPEVLRTKKYTCEADVYSFGIVIYEIITGLSPYYNIPHDVDLESKIINGLRPKLPSYVPKSIMQIISQCWDAVPDRRPNFKELKDKSNNLYSLDKISLCVKDNCIESMVVSFCQEQCNCKRARSMPHAFPPTPLRPSCVTPFIKYRQTGTKH